jgi:anion-transporting  ArsA/GET3 family ATPase
LRCRVIAILGKGGVGRTSISAALASFAAARGMRTLVMETDPRIPISASYGKHPGLAPLELAPNLYGLFLGGQESLEDYLGFVVPRPVLRAVFASSLYQYFVHAAPAVRELTMMGKVYHEIERRPKDLPPWDVIVLDAPASGQALSMIRMPFAARDTFGGGMVAREADDVARFFRDAEKCAMTVATTAEPLAMTETLEIHRALTEMELATAAIFFNRAAPAAFDSADIARFVRRGSQNPALAHIDDLARIARAELKRVSRERRALGILRRQTGAPVIELEERSGFSGRALVSSLAADLAKYASDTPAAAARPAAN